MFIEPQFSNVLFQTIVTGSAFRQAHPAAFSSSTLRAGGTFTGGAGGTVGQHGDQNAGGRDDLDSEICVVGDPGDLFVGKVEFTYLRGVFVRDGGDLG